MATSWNTPPQNNPTANLRVTSGLAKPAPPTDIGGRIKSHSSRAIRRVLEGGGHTHLQRVGMWGRTGYHSLQYAFPHPEPPFSLFFGVQNRENPPLVHSAHEQGRPKAPTLRIFGGGVRDREISRLWSLRFVLLLFHFLLFWVFEKRKVRKVVKQNFHHFKLL